MNGPRYEQAAHHSDEHDTGQHAHNHSARSHGSGEDFEQDWAEALRTRNPRWFAYPDANRDDQLSLVEWVKAGQILDLLHAHDIRGGRVLEYGCGAAGMSVFLKEHGFQSYGVDLSPDALKVALLNDRIHRTVAEPLRVVGGDATRLPMADATFDVVMSYGLLEHFDEKALRALLAEVVRVLKPGGLFVADIIPAGLNARAVGTAINLSGSIAYHLLRGQWAVARNLPQRYFGHYYETAFGPEIYTSLLRQQGLRKVQVQVCRPFPPLALWGKLDAWYTGLMRGLLPLWLQFDRSKARWTRYWGWMYLASGVRPK